MYYETIEDNSCFYQSPRLLRPILHVLVLHCQSSDCWRVTNLRQAYFVFGSTPVQNSFPSQQLVPVFKLLFHCVRSSTTNDIKPFSNEVCCSSALRWKELRKSAPPPTPRSDVWSMRLRTSKRSNGGLDAHCSSSAVHIRKQGQKRETLR